MQTPIKTRCRQCDIEFDSYGLIDYPQFCSEKCSMDKYGYTPEDFYPTSLDDRGEPE